MKEIVRNMRLEIFQVTETYPSVGCQLQAGRWGWKVVIPGHGVLAASGYTFRYRKQCERALRSLLPALVDTAKLGTARATWTTQIIFTDL